MCCRDFIPLFQMKIIYCGKQQTEIYRVYRSLVVTILTLSYNSNLVPFSGQTLFPC